MSGAGGEQEQEEGRRREEEERRGLDRRRKVDRRRELAAELSAEGTARVEVFAQEWFTRFNTGIKS